MSNFTSWLRKNIGSIVSTIGLILLVIITYGEMGELFTEKYWQNVGGNISSISALSIGLVLIQTSIKQGVSEQALSAGLNTETTKNKYTEHKAILKRNQEKQVYLPYFLSIRNARETKRRKREFLSENDFKNEKMLRLSNNKKLIAEYDRIQTNITVDSIKWSTTEIIYNKNGRIEKLETYRKKRLIKSIIVGFVWMFGTTLITGGLFLDKANIPFWQKTIKLVTYLISIAMSVVFDIGKNYEKGAFGVPNELEEINGIWEEFEKWEVPEWIVREVEDNEKEDKFNDCEIKIDESIKLLGFNQVIREPLKEETIYEASREEIIDTRTDLQEKSV